MTGTYPTPHSSESRSCFGIDFFTSREDAETAGRIVRDRGDTYRGGFYAGSWCGRDKNYDKVDPKTGRTLYAVTTA